MTVKEAYEIIKKENPGMKAIQCFDFADFYAFALAEESWNGELLGGAIQRSTKPLANSVSCSLMKTLKKQKKFRLTH